MSQYADYVADAAFLSGYNAYQQRYAETVAERDKVTTALVANATGGIGRVLDIGCSTGNLLKHLATTMPALLLTGGDLADSSLDCARANVRSVCFLLMNILDIYGGPYNCIVANAVTYLLDWPEYDDALRSIAKALKPGGTFIGLDWYHPFGGQDLCIVETTDGHPHGLRIHSRAENRAAEVFYKAGFRAVRFQPFTMPFDIPEPSDKSGTPGTYTKLLDGQRACFRGAVYQPWCHVIAVKEES